MDRIAWYLPLAAFLTACGAETSKYMTEAQPPRPIAASADAATVVFIVPDAQGGQAYLDARRGDVSDRIGKAYEVLGKLKPEDAEARTLRPEDGQ